MHRVLRSSLMLTLRESRARIIYEGYLTLTLANA